jgi:hypothetical protein
MVMGSSGNEYLPIEQFAYLATASPMGGIPTATAVADTRALNARRRKAMKASSSALTTAIVWAALGPLSLHVASAAGSKSCFEYEDACYTTAPEACAAVARARRADPRVDNPYGTVVGAKDAGDKFWCKLADKNGETDEQHYGSRRTTEADTPSAPGGPAPEPAKPDDSCKLDKLKGAKLRNQVIALVRQYTAEANQRLINDPMGVSATAPNLVRGFFTGDYGTLLENLVAKRVEADACLSKYIKHLSVSEQSKPGPNGEKGDHPDFQGIAGGLDDLTIDITTAEAKARKLATEGGKSKYVYIEYERGLCVDPTTKLATKIPKGANQALIKNGKCPDRWK